MQRPLEGPSALVLLSVRGKRQWSRHHLTGKKWAVKAQSIQTPMKALHDTPPQGAAAPAASARQKKSEGSEEGLEEPTKEPTEKATKEPTVECPTLGKESPPRGS